MKSDGSRTDVGCVLNELQTDGGRMVDEQRTEVEWMVDRQRTEGKWTSDGNQTKIEWKLDESSMNVGQKSNYGNMTNGAVDTTMLQSACELCSDGGHDVTATMLCGVYELHGDGGRQCDKCRVVAYGIATHSVAVCGAAARDIAVVARDGHCFANHGIAIRDSTDQANYIL